MPQIDDCSDEFWECLDRSGGCRMECRCGREHFDSYNSYDWEPGELDRLREWMKKEPDRVIEHVGCVEAAEIGGSVYVRGCPCMGLHNFERILIQNEIAFAKFLNWRSKQLQERATAIYVKGILVGEHAEHLKQWLAPTLEPDFQQPEPLPGMRGEGE